MEGKVAKYLGLCLIVLIGPYLPQVLISAAFSVLSLLSSVIPKKGRALFGASTG